MQKGSLSLAASFWVFYIWAWCFSLGTQTDCPIQLSPERVVVRHGSSVTADCSTSVQHEGIGWEASQGSVSMIRDKSLITWRVSELTEWDIDPYCFINYKKGDKLHQCLVKLPVTVYKTPDSVSISTVDHSGPMMEGEEYELQCDVLGVAPVQYLTVKWYKGQTLLHQTTFNQTTFNNDTIRTPVNETATLLIRPDRADDGAQYKCVAELELGAEGPQPHPTNSSDPLSVTVHFKPIINETKLPSLVHVIRGYSEEIVCEAKGNPKPTISWTLGTNSIIYSKNLTVTESTPHPVSCTANNSVGTTTRHVTVSIQDISISFVNHTGPMIAGKPYELQCDVLNMDPSKSVVVRWYKLNKIISTENNMSSVNGTYKLKIHPSKTDDGAQYWCEVELKSEGLHRYQTMASNRLNITVHYKPIINETKLPSRVPVFRGYPEVLVCEAEGNPKPTITWILGTDRTVNSDTLNITESTPENVSCTANSSAGTTTRHVKVVLKEDYLPLIAGLIAVIVAFISVIFVFIYSIYYKAAKMGHYSLKDAKPAAQNGNVAQNGKHNPIPMKKLSQSNILA
ncbi:hemicentin-1 [Puntigrus tetrazona]|uniref:hemicentin-1 n=1 Tax=Puntigrus tetrazona TaxID=1606681 RepID=UPI001C8A5FDE|nr:hemicentin-1 [Puntigrus tetrazona]